MSASEIRNINALEIILKRKIIIKIFSECGRVARPSERALAQRHGDLQSGIHEGRLKKYELEKLSSLLCVMYYNNYSIPRCKMLLNIFSFIKEDLCFSSSEEFMNRLHPFLPMHINISLDL